MDEIRDDLLPALFKSAGSIIIRQHHIIDSVNENKKCEKNKEYFPDDKIAFLKKSFVIESASK